MAFIDPHLHTHWVGGGELENLATAGLIAAVIPTPHKFLGLVSAEEVFRLWRRFLDFEVKNVKANGIDAWVTLGIPFYGIEKAGVEQCLKELPDYLKHERVVGVGEIGLDAGIEDEVKLFRAQLRIAADHKLPIIVHTCIRYAPQAPAVTRQIVNIIKEEGFPIERAVLDHTGESTVDFRLNSGAMVGLSVCGDKLPPEVAADIVAKNPDKRDKIFINSELGWGHGGYFSVARTIQSMRKCGLNKSEIEKVTIENPIKFFNLPLKP
jgi:predicted metal-dependent TIM-barrel fold hydrolase